MLYGVKMYRQIKHVHESVYNTSEILRGLLDTKHTLKIHQGPDAQGTTLLPMQS